MSGIDEGTHAAIHTEKYAPDVRTYWPDAPPGLGQRLLESLRVRPKRDSFGMPEFSLVDFGKTWNIDRDVQVMIFGEVYQDSQDTLRDNWNYLQSTIGARLSDEERQGHQVDDRNRNERNQDRFGDDD